MKKKTIVLVATVVMMLAALAIGGTLAYFTDKEVATNEFTLGNVVIDLVEEQRDGNGGLEEFEDDKVLLPIVGSAQGEKEAVGGYNLPTAENWVDKIVTVDNEGTQPAYVRVLFAFPADMDDAQSAAEMMLHWNYDGSEASNTWTRTDCGVKVTVGEKDYNVYNYTYNAILPVDGTTASPAITGLYIDSRVDATVDENGAVTYSMKNGRDEVVSATYAKDTAPKLLVLAQGVQSAGFEDQGADAALTAGFGDVAENAQAWFNAIGETDERADVQ